MDADMQAVRAVAAHTFLGHGKMAVAHWWQGFHVNGSPQASACGITVVPSDGWYAQHASLACRTCLVAWSLHQHRPDVDGGA